MTSPGQELKRERELRGISLKEISTATKIHIKFFQALEDDRLEVMPSKFFTKALLRSYAKFVGLEEDSVLNRYYEMSLLQSQAQQAEIPKRKAPPLVRKKGWMISVILVVPLILAIFFLQKKYVEESRASAIKEGTPVLTPLPAPQLVYIFILEQRELTFEISFLEETWIQVFADGELIIDGIKWPGDKAVVNAQQELLIHLGNAGGITYSLNNKKGKSLGRPGTVIKNIRITLENYQKFLSEEEKTIDGR
jgi:transcriptional regulator with XRE-family HTH domain